MEGETSGINPYAGDGGIGVVSNVDNLLRNHSFRNLAYWWQMPNNCGNTSEGNVFGESVGKFGRHALAMSCYTADCTENGVYQTTETLPAGSYTFSAYVRVMTTFA